MIDKTAMTTMSRAAADTADMVRGLTASLDEVEGWLEELYNCRLLSERNVGQLCSAAREVLVQESNVKLVRSERIRHHTVPHYIVPHYICSTTLPHHHSAPYSTTSTPHQTVLHVQHVILC